MKKILLSFCITLLSVCMAFAAPVEIVMSDVAPSISGTSSTFTASGFTFKVAKNNGQTSPTYNTNGKDVRIYAKGTLTISSETEMTEIIITLSTQGLKRLATITADNGTIATQSSGDTTVSWKGSAKSVTFTVGDTAVYGSDGSSKGGQLDFTKVSIDTESQATDKAPEAIVATPAADNGEIKVDLGQKVSFTSNYASALKVSEDATNYTTVEGNTYTITVTEPIALTIYPVDYRGEDVMDLKEIFTIEINAAEQVVVSPAGGAVEAGTEVTITGKNAKQIVYLFGDGEVQTVNGTEAKFTVNKAGELMAHSVGFDGTETEAVIYEYTIKEKSIGENVYEPLTNLSYLEEGTQVIFVGENAGKYYSMYTATRTNNMGAAEISNLKTTADGKIVSTTIGTGTLVFNVNGNATAGYSFETTNYLGTNGYLASQTSNNRLVVSSTLNANSKAAVSLNEDGTAGVKFNAGASSYVRFNYNSGSPIFNCYNSATGQNPVTIFIQELYAPMPAIEGADEMNADAFNCKITPGSDVTVSFNVPAGITLYYQIDKLESGMPTDTPKPEGAPARVAKEGYTEYVSGTPIAINDYCNLEYYTESNATGRTSQPHAFGFYSQTTGIENVAVGTQAEAVYYDLNGRRVANPANGIFIRIAGGKATKIVK